VHREPLVSGASHLRRPLPAVPLTGQQACVLRSDAARRRAAARGAPTVIPPRGYPRRRAEAEIAARHGRSILTGQNLTTAKIDIDPLAKH
jgi:hypothetical protein